MGSAAVWSGAVWSRTVGSGAVRFGLVGRGKLGWGRVSSGMVGCAEVSRGALRCALVRSGVVGCGKLWSGVVSSSPRTVSMATKLEARREQLRKDQVTNGGEDAIEAARPYRARIKISGVSPILFHRYDVEEVKAKGEAAKGSKAKKTDAIDSYVYRTRTGLLGLPGLNFVASIIKAAKSHADPRSPRKSLRDLAQASVIPLDDVVAFEPPHETWDFLDRRRVIVQRNAVTRVRPALLEGWTITFTVQVIQPQYVPPAKLQELVRDAGQFCGLGDYTPTFGRFAVVGFEVLTDEI